VQRRSDAVFCQRGVDHELEQRPRATR
jgi:hypothetical protein